MASKLIKKYISISKIVFNSDLQSIHMEYCFFFTAIEDLLTNDFFNPLLAQVKSIAKESTT